MLQLHFDADIRGIIRMVAENPGYGLHETYQQAILGLCKVESDVGDFNDGLERVTSLNKKPPALPYLSARPLRIFVAVDRA